MTGDRVHDEMSTLLPALALDLLEQDELHGVLDHVKACPECVRQLAEYQEAVARMAIQLPPRPMDTALAAGIRHRLLSRVRGAGRGLSPLPTRHSRFSARMIRWPGWAVAAGLIGLVLVHHSVHRPVDYGWLVAGVLAVSLAVLALYVRRQAARHSALQQRLANLERNTVEPGDRPGRRDRLDSK